VNPEPPGHPRLMVRSGARVAFGVVDSVFRHTLFSTGLRVDEGVRQCLARVPSRAKKIPHGPTEWAREGKFTLLECSQDSSRALSEAERAKPSPASQPSPYSILLRPFIVGAAFGDLLEGALPGVPACCLLLRGPVVGHVGSSGLAIGGPVCGLPGAGLL
jgi:hypothetical protein